MVEKTESSTSIGFADDEENQLFIPKRVDPLPYNRYLKHICVFVIKCDHKRMPLFRIKERKSLWLPYVSVSEGQKWVFSSKQMQDWFIKEQLTDAEQQLSVKSENSKSEKDFIDGLQMMAITRVQLPTEEFVDQTVFCAKWINNTKIVCCKDTHNIVWHSIKDVISGDVTRFWGKEVIDYANHLTKSTLELQRSFCLLSEEPNEKSYRFLTFDIKSKDRDQQMIAEAIKATGVDRKVMEKLFSDYTQHCYPSIYMSYVSFKDYLTQMEFKTNNESTIKRLFIAMTSEWKDFLTFDDYFLGVLSFEPDSPQNERRFGYIFRYYDSDSDGFLNRDDVRQMVIDMRSVRSHEEERESIGVVDNEALNQALNEEIEEVMNIDGISDITMTRISRKSFISKAKAGAEQLKPLRFVFRSTGSLIKMISEKRLYETIHRNSMPLNTEERTGCPKHSEKNPTYAIHSLEMTSKGRLVNPQDLRQTDEKDIDFDLHSMKEKLVEMQRQHSIEVANNPNSVPNYILSVIRELVTYINRTDVSEEKKIVFKNTINEKLTVEVIQTICSEIREIFREEFRVLKTQSPIWILGDIHGNLRDLLYFEQQLWRTAPQLMPSNILFLGDYVDRGEFGVECVLYLWALKASNPLQFFFLRGNHEIRSVQKRFTFEKECLKKYGKDGQKVFELINETFDVMPIAATVDETVFCAHGGIPYSLKTVAELHAVPIELKNPETECPAVWELLWSDPLDNEEYQKIKKLNKIRNDNGFIGNTKRGTAFYYSNKALTDFLTLNDIDYVIRAHESLEDGYKFYLDGRVISIFTSSNYCGSNNKASAVRIEASNGKDADLIKLVILRDPADPEHAY